MRLVRGVGINDADYKVNPGGKGQQIMCPYYKTWMNMLNRVYTPSRRDDSYENCVVFDEWLRFSNFRNWMVSQDWEGKNLDKDLRVIDNNVYSPSTCCFISQKLNVAISKKKKKRDLPVGVEKLPSGRYSPRLGIDGVLKTLGTYDDMNEAAEVYTKASNEYIICIAKECDNAQVLEFVEIRFGAKHTV